MKVLIDVEADELQKNILNSLKKEPGIQTLVYNQQKDPVNCLTDNIAVIITGTSLKDRKWQVLFNALQADRPLLHFIAVGPVEHHAQLFDWLCKGATAALLNIEIKTCLIPILMALNKSGPSFTAMVSRRLLPAFRCHNSAPAAPVDYHLTPREKEVLTAIVTGLNYKMAGYELNISPETVRGHIKNIYRKLQVVSQTQAVAKAIYHNLV